MIPLDCTPVMKQFPTSNRHDGPMDSILTNQALNKSSLSNKRKASKELMPDVEAMQKVESSFKTLPVGSLSNTPRLLQSSASSKRMSQMESMVNSPRSANPSKKVLHVDSVVNKSVLKNRNAQPETSPKTQNETFDSVRSKLKESLAAALAMVSQQQESPTVEKQFQSEAAISAKSKPSESTSSTGGAAVPESKKAAEALPPNAACPATDGNNVKTSEGIHSNDVLGVTANSWEFLGPEFQSNPVLHDEDASFSDSFFIKDDLLLGNGLSWALDDVEAAGMKEAEPSEKPKLMHGDACGGEQEQALPSPDSIACRIESELFKLFGGVNKKYKERGRSLLFNLKDRNNPELRERVMSGEIPPGRLCSMTAEELASEELSQWRMAKAEELAQMKVLPDTGVDMRRLVKKTHKGEFQVEVEQDVSASVEVPVNARLLPQSRSETRGTDAQPLSKADGTKDKADVMREMHNSEDQDDEGRLTIPSDSADMMQGLMVDDMRDLPPIVSLDEFMDSLDKEPPFVNLPVDSVKKTLLSEKKISEADSELKSGEQALKVPIETKKQRTEEVNLKRIKPDADVKPISSGRETQFPIRGVTKGERVWEGLLQLNVSSMANVVGFYKSGEKAITKDWPNFFEIKGRVKLDAFEKFLQELPMSRSRAIMVSHFALKEESTDSDRANLQEVADSFIVDERLGFAEPAPGVELYFCPTHKSTLDMLSNRLPKNYTEKLDAIDNGLIGVVVWRKAHLTSAISPKSSSQRNNDNPKRQQHFTSRRHSEGNTNSNVNYASRTAAPTMIVSEPQSEVDEDDDIPPGFGPPAARDDDDLPEFKFSGSTDPIAQISSQNPSQVQGMATHHRVSPTLPRQVEHMRELVKKYGQNGNNVVSGIPLESWNDDEDDDDIPEWQPPAPQQQLPPPQPAQQSLQLPVFVPHMANQPPLQPPLTQLAEPMQPLQVPINPLGAPWQQGGWWPPGTQPANLGSQPIGGQFHGASGLVAGQWGREWRPDGSRNRSRGP
ncbi:hypothetical protein Nepgr_008840 [Nepenthes gracilis]|uniref:TFIIS central domain-containing protein n=1 Tax=Nepenthes gracilis TaxID=150966 RepID=A0AAD3S9W4_NEPGR|nr:hypothetical protein Nepgr_008840 [Nepenthes gracilis]